MRTATRCLRLTPVVLAVVVGWALIARAAAPNPPALVDPPNNATEVSFSPTLSTSVSDPDGTPLKVAFYGRPATGENFSIIVIRDTQFYSESYPLSFAAQTQWIVNSKDSATLLADYQSRPNGGDGWLRILEFAPAANEIRVKTFSPVLNQYETDANSQFTFPYDGFQLLGINPGVPTESTTSITWPAPGLNPFTEYEWYASVSDDGTTIKGIDQYPTVTWTTGGHTGANVPVYAWGANADLIWGTMDNTGFFAIAIAGDARVTLWVTAMWTAATWLYC